MVGVAIVLVLIFVVVSRPYLSERSVEEFGTVDTELVSTELDKPTERYRARVDRVQVQFEHWDSTRYRLQTNDLVREGEMNSERGYETDPDATVYVLNWQKPIGEHIRYVRLTAEPTALYILNSKNKIVLGSKLTLE